MPYKDPQARRENSRKWRRENPKANRDYYGKHSKEISRRRKLKYSQNPEKFIFRSLTQKRKYSQKAMEIFGNKCLVCECYAPSKSLNLHEIHGQRHEMSNRAYALKHQEDFAPLCNKCHMLLHYLKRLGKNRKKLFKLLRKLEAST